MSKTLKMPVSHMHLKKLISHEHIINFLTFDFNVVGSKKSCLRAKLGF